MADHVVLNFHDSLLRKSDVKLLDEGQWLNDKIIGFMFEYYEYILFTKMKDTVFVNPDVAQYIKLCKGAELAAFLEPLNLHSKKTIFIPVNSQTNLETAGGAHWSLLVYYSQQEKFRHYDSLSPSNNQDAVQMGKAIEPYLRVTQNVKFVEELCPQQTNSYDCGMYVVCTTEMLCTQALSDEQSDQRVHSELNPESVKRKRSEIKNIIKSLRNTESS